MHRLFVVLILGLVTNIVFAQSFLEVEDISRSNDVYPNIRDSSLVLVYSHKSIPLSFYTYKSENALHDQPIAPSKTVLSDADEYIYYFVFSTRKGAGNIKLTISASGIGSKSISITVGPKQVKRFRVARPFNFIVEECYSQHRNVALKEIEKGNYAEALDQLRIANECFDLDTIENTKNIRYVNSLINNRKNGDEAFDMHDYKKASEYYSFLFRLNPADSFAVNRYNICQNYLVFECNSLFERGKILFKAKEYAKAKDVFEVAVRKVADLGDVDIRKKYNLYVYEWLDDIKKEETFYNKRNAKKERFHAIAYEFRKDAFLGFSYGAYKESKTGSFFHLCFSPKLLDEIRSDCWYGDDKFFEINMELGWTMKIRKPLWVHFGPGFTGKLYHGTYLSGKYPKDGYGEFDLLDKKAMGDNFADAIPEEYVSGWKKTNMAFAIAPVVGVDLKFEAWIIRVTYQYRWAIEAGLAEFIGRNRFSVGLGLTY